MLCAFLLFIPPSFPFSFSRSLQGADVTSARQPVFHSCDDCGSGLCVWHIWCYGLCQCFYSNWYFGNPDLYLV